MIDGVKIKEFQDIMTPQGGVQHMLKLGDGFFQSFGEMYFSIINPGVIKGWHKQFEQTNIFSCIKGKIRLVLYDKREGSPTFGAFQEIVFGDGERKIVLIPSNITYGWKCISDEPAMIANLATQVHDPAKAIKLGLQDIPYRW